MKYFQWEIVTYPEIPDRYAGFYEECWALFQQEFDFSSHRKVGSWLLNLLCVFSPEGTESSNETYQKISHWYEAVRLLMEEYSITLANLHYWNGEEYLTAFREQSFHVTVNQEDIPILLQYYNPVVAPHTGELWDPCYEYTFNEEGDFDFTVDFVPMPGPSLFLVSMMLEAGLLEEDRGTIEPISAWL